MTFLTSVILTYLLFILFVYHVFNMKRLYKDEPGESFTGDAHRYIDKFRVVLDSILDDAVEDGVSLRDLQLILSTELDCEFAIRLIKSGIAHRKKLREGK